MARRSLLVAGLALVLAPGALPASAATLTKSDRAQIVRDLARRRSTVTVLIAAQPGASAAVADRLQALGGAIVYRDDDVGYMRVDIAPARAADAAAATGVAAANLDVQRPQVYSGPPSEVGLPVPDANTPAVNPFLPVADVGAPQFIAAHPTFDGRGTTLGIIDDGVDLLTPELRFARLADGTRVDKLVDFVTQTDPGSDPTWVDEHATVPVRSGSFTFAGRTFTLPAGKASYRIGLLNERAPGFPIADRDLDRDGNPPGSSGLFGVLWDTVANRVWVDTDRDGSFADQSAMTDYRLAHDHGVFGTDDPSTAIRESVPFVVQTDPQRKLVDINIETEEAHGTAVASVAVGAGFFGGHMDGAAPAARLAMVRTDLFPSQDIEGALYLVKRDHVDALSLSYGADVGSTENVEGVVLSRIADKLGVQTFAAAGNARMTLNTVGEPSTTLDVVSVASSATRATTRAVSGYDMGVNEGIEWYSSRGPSVDGALKPDLAAPGMTWAALPGWQPSTPYAPQGYQRARGTSFATPIAAGGALLLLSAARQSQVSARADQLRLALYSSARRVAASTHEQGRGVLSVSDAWNLLRRNLQPVAIEASGPVQNAFSLNGFIPSTGPGLYEREGWTAGQSGVRAVTLTRTSGPSGGIPYQLSLTGNDGTFGVPASVTLTKGVPRAVSVAIHPAGYGVHAAILNVDDPTTLGIDAQVALTVVAAEQYDNGNHFAITHTGAVANDGVADHFFAMPDDAFAWDNELSSASPTAELSWSIAGRFGPITTLNLPFPPVGAIFPVTLGCWVPSQSVNCGPPPPGRVFEYAISTAFQSAPTTPYTLATRVRGRVSVTPSPVVIDPGTTGTTYDRTLQFETGSIGFEGRARGSDLGPLHASRPTIAEGDFFSDQFVVTPGTTRLTAEIDHAADPDADLDLYLLQCELPDCSDGGGFFDFSTTPTATEWIDVEDPPPGYWTVFVDGFSIPSGATEFDYAHVATEPAFGSIAVTDADAFHPAFDHWTRDIHVTPLQAPAGGEALRGYVRTPGGWTDVDVRNLAAQ